jgi:hypothetical protein
LPEPRYPVSFQTLQPGVSVVSITLAIAHGHEVLPGIQPAQKAEGSQEFAFEVP